MDSLFAQAGFTKTGEYNAEGAPIAQVEPVAQVQQEQQQQPAGQEASEQAQVVQPTVTPTAITPSIDELISGKFDGRFKSVDEVAEAFRKVEQDAKKDPFANDWIRNLNKAVAEGVDPAVYMEVSNVDTEKLSEADAIILQMQWKDGLTREEAEFLVNRKYRLGGEDEVDPSDPDAREAAINLKLEGRSAKEFLSKYKQEALTSPIEKRQAEIKSAWEPAIPTVLEKYKTFPIEGKSGQYNFPVPPEALGKAQELLQSVIDSGMFDTMPDREGMEYAEAIVRNEILSNMVSTMIDAVADQYKQKALAEKHNPRKPESMDRQPVLSGQDGLIDFLKAQRGMK